MTTVNKTKNKKEKSQQDASGTKGEQSQKQIPSRNVIRDANTARRPKSGLCRDDGRSSRPQGLKPPNAGHFSARLPFVPQGEKPCPDENHL
jgi:hypothetical protein